MRIIATDSGANPRTATALLYVTVLRNLNNPAFLPGSLQLSYAIPEDRALSVPFPDRLQGSDNDLFEPNNQVNFRFRSTSSGQTYFGVDAATGDVFVKSDLRLDPLLPSQYIVSCYCLDLDLMKFEICVHTKS